MLRINLLPAYVLLRRRNRQVAVAFAGLFALLTVGALLWYAELAPQPAQIAAKVAEGQAMQTKIAGVNAAAAAAITGLGQINTNLQTYQAIQTYNLAYPQLFQRVANYTSPRVLYNAMSVAGTTMTISGYTHSIGDLGRYLQLMYTEPDTAGVSLTSAIPAANTPSPDVAQTYSIPAGVVARLPGYPHPITSYTVKKGVIVSVNSGGAGTGAAGGRFGGVGLSQPSFGGPSGAPRGFGGRPGGAPSFGAPSFGAQAGFGGSRGAFGQGANAAGVKLFDARHDGFPFTVALTLKQPLVAPAPGGAATGAAGAAGARGPGGFPGGPPGAPGFPGAPGGSPGVPRYTGAPPGGRSTLN